VGQFGLVGLLETCQSLVKFCIIAFSVTFKGASLFSVLVSNKLIPLSNHILRLRINRDRDSGPQFCWMLGFYNGCRGSSLAGQ
jgi:hypothetical protein